MTKKVVITGSNRGIGWWVVVPVAAGWLEQAWILSYTRFWIWWWCPEPDRTQDGGCNVRVLKFSVCSFGVWQLYVLLCVLIPLSFPFHASCVVSVYLVT